MTPKFLTEKGYVFKVYSREEERVHIHVTKENKNAKYWLEPKIELAKNKGFAKHELTKIKKIITKNESNFKKQWNKYFK